MPVRDATSSPWPDAIDAASTSPVEADAGRSDADVEATVRYLPHLCTPGAWVVWTRGPRDDDILSRIEGWFAEAGFEPHELVVGAGGLFGVGAARFRGTPLDLRRGDRIFGEFVR